MYFGKFNDQFDEFIFEVDRKTLNYKSNFILNFVKNKENSNGSASNYFKLSNNFDEFIKQKKDEDNLIISKRMVKEIERFLDYMSDKGYCNDEILGKEMKYTFKELVYSIKAITFDNTKSK